MNKNHQFEIESLRNELASKDKEIEFLRDSSYILIEGGLIKDKYIESLKHDAAVYKKAHEIATDNFIIAAKQVEQAIADWEDFKRECKITKSFRNIHVCDSALKKLRKGC